MKRRESQALKAQSDGATEDVFLGGIRDLIESGRFVVMPETLLKADIVARVQKFSSEIPLLQGDISDAFLRVCDLMIDGQFSRMAMNAFRVYLVLLAYSNAAQSDTGTNRGRETLASILGPSDLANALQELKDAGHIESVENPALTKARRSGKKGGDEKADRLFAIA